MAKRSYRKRKIQYSYKNIFWLVVIIMFLPILLWSGKQVQNIISFGASSAKVTSLASASGLSQSKLGIFILGFNPQVNAIVDSGPRVIKLLIGNPNDFVKGGYGGYVSFAKNYKTQYPEGKVVLRIFDYWQNPGVKKYTQNDDPQQAAEEVFDWYKPVLDILREKGDMGYFDYLGGPPNETERTPYWSEGGNVAWLSAFWSRIVDLNLAAGIKTCAGNILTGDLATKPDDISILQNGLFAKLNATGGVICYNAYSDTGFDTNAVAQEEQPLLYRKMYRTLGGSTPQMIIGELGIADGWQKAGTAAQYEEWLKWYDSEIQKDPFIIGATLYGDNSNISSVADWLADYIRAKGEGVGSLLTPTPTVAVCIPNFCFIDASSCCFDPMCIFLGNIGVDRGGRCIKKAE